MTDSHQEKPADIKEAELPERPKEKKIIYFSNGETLEVEDSEEEEEEEPRRSPFQEPATRFSFRKMALLIGRKSLLACDYLGKRFAAVLGLNVAKYQYAIDQYHRHHKETGSPAAEEPTQSVQLSCLPARGRYGATGDVSCSAVPQERQEESTEGRHNRGYREDEDVSK